MSLTDQRMTRVMNLLIRLKLWFGNALLKVRSGGPLPLKSRLLSFLVIFNLQQAIHRSLKIAHKAIAHINVEEFPAQNDLR